MTDRPSDTTADVASPPRTGEPDPRRWAALAIIAAATLMVVLDASIVNIALPEAQADLGIADLDRQWVVTAYTLAFGGLLLLGGRVADLVGRKRAFIVGLAGFAGASAIGGLAVNAPMLFGARALQGAFAALLAPAALSLVAVTFVRPGERAKAFAVYGAVQGGGGAVGLLAGGVLTEYASWRWCLILNVPLAVAAVVAAVPLIRESQVDDDRRYDVLGAVLATGGLVALVYGFTRAAEGAGWLDPATFSLLAAAALALVAFVAVEARTEQPLLPLRVVLDRNRGAAFATSVLIAGSMFGMFLFLTYYFQVDLGYQPLKAGLAFLPFTLGLIITASLTSVLLPRFGPKAIMAVGMALATAGMGWLTRLDSASDWITGVLPSEILMGAGIGLVYAPLFGMALTGVDERDSGVASGLVDATTQVGAAIGVALLNTLFTSSAARYAASRLDGAEISTALRLESDLHGYRTAFAVGTGLFALAFLVILTMKAANPHVAASET